MKYIYLDQNKWIELAKGIKNKNNRYILLHEKIIKKISNGEWAFPLSLIHINESIKRKEENSRKELLNLMCSISQGCTMCDFIMVDDIEFRTWINKGFVNTCEIRSEIIKNDWAFILGKSSIEYCNKEPHIEHFYEIIKKESCSKKTFDLICDFFISNSLSDTIKKDEDFYYEKHMKIREGFLSWKKEIETLDEYKKRYLYPTFHKKIYDEMYMERIKNLDEKHKRNIIDFFEKRPRCIGNLEILPNFDVYSKLIFELCNNAYKEVHEHDFNDLAYLRVAIPYCDLVIGEKYWCDRVRHYKLDKKYNTIVEKDLFRLESYD